MQRRFHKMHGLGNDFVVLDARAEPIAITPERARALADRRTGIGCDQLILLEPSSSADLKMRIFNADGGEVGACGNAARCVTWLEGGSPRIETAGGIIEGHANGAGAIIDMGEPRLAWDQIPLAYPMDTSAMPVGWESLTAPFAVNIGNPHVVFFVDQPVDEIELDRLGPLIEADPLFPERVNVNVARAEDKAVQLRVWERGAGLTRACGTGACATAVAAIATGRARSPVQVHLPGGRLTIEWQRGGTVRMSGPAALVFTGEIDLEALA